MHEWNGDEQNLKLGIKLVFAPKLVQKPSLTLSSFAKKSHPLLINWYHVWPKLGIPVP
jgi:hypothetical protein